MKDPTAFWWSWYALQISMDIWRGHGHHVLTPAGLRSSSRATPCSAPWGHGLVRGPLEALLGGEWAGTGCGTWKPSEWSRQLLSVDLGLPQGLRSPAEWICVALKTLWGFPGSIMPVKPRMAAHWFNLGKLDLLEAFYRQLAKLDSQRQAKSGGGQGGAQFLRRTPKGCAWDLCLVFSS